MSERERSVSEQTPESTKVDRPDMTGWIIWQRAFWCLATLARVTYFLTGSRVEKFSATTQIPEWAAVSFAILLVLTSLSMTVEGFLRPPGRFAGVGCALIAVGLKPDWTRTEEVSAAIGLMVIGLAIEVFVFRYSGQKSTRPQVEKLSE